MAKESSVVKMPALGDVGAARDTTMRTMSAMHHPSSGRFDGAVYNQLKQRVSSLKHEQRAVQRNQRTAEEMESVAILEQRYRYEATIRQLEENLAKAQEQVKVNTDRSSKMRLHFDRERKSLTSQLEQLKVNLDSIGDEHQSQVAALKADHEREVHELRDQLTQLQQTSAEQEASERAAHAAALEEVDQWCCGEIEAVRHVARQEKLALEQEVTKWQEEFEKQRERRAQAEEAARETEAQLRVAQEEVVRLTEALAKSQMACESTQQQLDQTVQQSQERLQSSLAVAKANQEEQVLELKARHAQQLELINTRVQEVIAVKEATITALRQELQELQEHMQQLLA